MIGIVETWLNDNIDDGEVSIPEYTMYRNDCSSNKLQRGGGVILYVHNSLNSCICVEPSKFKSESVWCKLLLGQNQETMNQEIKNPCVGVCYRSPTADITEVNNLFSPIKCLANSQVLIIGDFNY